MDPLNAVQEETGKGVVNKVAHVTWSQRRSWHGEEVTMSVRTELVANGTAVEIKVLAKEGEAEVDKANGSVSGSKLDHKYKIEWKDKPYGEKREFILKALIGPEGKRLEPKSEPLVVDLEPPMFSA